MPNVIKKVLANISQTFSDSEKSTARNNIDAASRLDVQYWHTIENIDTSKDSYENSNIITSFAGISLYYYFGNDLSLRIAVQNQRDAPIDRLDVISYTGCDTFENLAVGLKQTTSVNFYNGNANFQNIRLVVDGTEIYDVSIQLAPSRETLFYKKADDPHQGYDV